MIAILLKLLGWVKCPHCQRYRRDVDRRRTPTAYVDDSQNYTVCCPECFEEECDYWHDMWSEYWGGCM